ncbi:MAG: universal stress protein [Acidimicrobiales bacterium]
MTPEHDATPNDGGSPQIVVGIDGSAPSLEALDWAAEQAALTRSPLEIVTTWEWPMTYGWAVPLPAEYDPKEIAQKTLEEAADGVRAKYPDMEITTRALQGHPAPALVEASKGQKLLVVGSRGHGEFVGMLLGSVGEHCAAHAHCPVLIHRAAD